MTPPPDSAECCSSWTAKRCIMSDMLVSRPNSNAQHPQTTDGVVNHNVPQQMPQLCVLFLVLSTIVKVWNLYDENNYIIAFLMIVILCQFGLNIDILVKHTFLQITNVEKR